MVGISAVVFSTVKLGVVVTGVVRLSSTGGIVPLGGVAATLTSLKTSPASISDCSTAMDVHVYTCVSPTSKTVSAVIDSEANVNPEASHFTSVSVTAVRDTLPVLFTSKLYVKVSPALVGVSAVVFSTVKSGICVIRVVTLLSPGGVSSESPVPVLLISPASTSD